MRNILLIIVLALNALAGQCQNGSDKPTIVLFIAVDDLRPNTGAYGDSVVTLPQVFKNNGYHSVAIGKIFHGQKFAMDTASLTRPPILNLGAALHGEGFSHMGYSVRSDQFRLTLWFNTINDEIEERELYDMGEGIELENISGNAEYKKVEESLSTLLIDFRNQKYMVK